MCQSESQSLAWCHCSSNQAHACHAYTQLAAAAHELRPDEKQQGSWSLNACAHET